MFYIMKSHQTGWENKDKVYEYILFNPKKNIKTSLNCTSKHMELVTIFFDTLKIPPSTAQRMKLDKYETVTKTKFLGYDK